MPTRSEAAGRRRGMWGRPSPRRENSTVVVWRPASPDPEHLLGGDHGLDGVFGVAVGADLVGPGTGRGGAADHHLTDPG